jgi:hypothetical protein
MIINLIIKERSNFMAVLAKKFNIQKTGSSTVACNIYTTTTEAGSAYICANVNGTNGYIAIGATSHAKATVGRVTKSGTTYAILTASTVPYTKKTYTTAGTYTFTIPAGITKVKLTIAGGGGGGGYNVTYSYYYSGCKTSGTRYATEYGGTGGRGGLATGTKSVTSNATYTITVGAGGAACKAGGKSSFGSLLSATGGGAATSAYSYYYYDGEYSSHHHGGGSNGAAGTPSGSGGAGGSSGGGSGMTGWVYVEYGEGIE